MRIIAFVILLVVLPVKSETIVSLGDVRQAGLPIVYITTTDNEEPEGVLIESPLFADSYNITYKNKVPCRIIIYNDGDTIYDSGEYIKKTSGATIRINGNTTAYFSHPLNMPYKLKLQTAADLLFRGNDNKYKDKEWRLLKDAVSLNTIVGFKISQLLELEWTPAYIPCNVIINGDYRGCYLLMETMKRNDSCRVACDKQTGYIVEKDPYWWKETQFFSSSWYKDDNVYRWTWKYPDKADKDDIQEAYIRQYIESMEKSLDAGNYESFIDVASFSKWILAHDVVGTRDSWGSNMYIKKYDNTDNSKLELPCVWDFDSSNDLVPGSFSSLHTQDNEYFYALFNSSNRSFAEAYKSLWNRKKHIIQDSITTFIKQYAESDEGKALDTSRQLYNRRFGYTYPTIAYDAEQQLRWYGSHLQLLDEQIQLIDSKLSDIHISPNKQTEIQKIYDITGFNTCDNRKHGITIYRRKSGSSYQYFKVGK